MSDAEIEVLRQRYEKDPSSLTMDEVGVLYVVTRERIRDFERKAGGDGDNT
jgi:DNA-directed RNA polymerase sigma subunit (sigma70/sigma32)